MTKKNKVITLKQSLLNPILATGELLVLAAFKLKEGIANYY